MISLASLLALSTTLPARGDSDPPQSLDTPVRCEGFYPAHLQGVCLDEDQQAIYWSFTVELVKTDLHGKVLRKVKVANHHGDLCSVDGKVYVAVNLGKFNRPAGEADSWVYVYDAETLEELARHEVQEVVHGAGGMAYHHGRFLVVGGLPDNFGENYLYEYNGAFEFQGRHTLESGHTLLGIQTAAFAEGAWWFGCYGSPPVLLKADEDLQFVGRWEFNASLGIEALGDGKLLVAEGIRDPEAGYSATLRMAEVDEDGGLRRIEVR